MEILEGFGDLAGRILGGMGDFDLDVFVGLAGRY